MGQPEFSTAKEIAEFLMNRGSEGLTDQDFATFAGAFKLPFVLHTANAQITLQTPNDLRAAFDQMGAYYRSLNVTSFQRACEAAAYTDSDTLQASCLHAALSGDKYVIDPYASFMVAKRIGDEWKVASLVYDLDDENPLAVALRGLRPKDPVAMTIYQRHVDTVAAALLSNDFPMFRDRVQLPLQITTETEVVVIETENHLQTVFENVAASYKARAVDDLVRTVRDAHFYSENEIRGLHESDWIQSGQRLVTPYPNRLRMVRDIDGQWRATHSANAIRNTSENHTMWFQVSSDPTLPELTIAPERKIS